MSNSASPKPPPGQGTQSLFLSALLIFLVPVLSWVFISWADSNLNYEAAQAVRRELIRKAIEETRTAAKAGHVSVMTEINVAEVDPSSPEAQAIQQALEPRRAVLRWGKWTAIVCMEAAGAVMIPMLGLIALAKGSRNALYQSLRTGWWVLRWLALAEVVGQGALLVLLTFLVPAMLIGFVAPKLVILTGLGALCGAALLIKAIFTKFPDSLEIKGELLTEAEAPAIWQRVDEASQRFQTTPLDRIIVGVDARFFVTQHPVSLEGQILTGRTLYLSLPLLEKMTVAEADAVLGHEMAHFSGEDTEFTMKITPLLQRWELYLYSLCDGVTKPVFHFMNFFYGLHMKMLGEHRRTREFQADRMGARLSSPQAMAQALVKVTAYARWRDSTEGSMLKQTRRKEHYNIKQQVDAGFLNALRKFTTGPQALKEETPHPFDSHPPLRDRMQSLGLDPNVCLRDGLLFQPVTMSWCHAIGNVSVLEETLWNDHERELEQLHDQILTLRSSVVPAAS